MIVWCQKDAEVFGLTVGKWTKLGLIFVFPIALISHFFRTRGSRGILTLVLATLFGGGLVLIKATAIVCTHFFMYGDLSRL